MEAVERSYDHALVDHYLSRSGYGPALRDFQERMWIAYYSKGEFVSSPLQREPLFQVVVQGSLNIYCIRDDGTLHSISCGQDDYPIGEMELFSSAIGNVYAEAESDLICLALSIEENREVLLQNSSFLCLICESLTRKMQSLTTIAASPADLRQRVLTYMRYMCVDGEVRGLQQAAFRLNCSPRQLQRIFNQYEAEGNVVKIGKGDYRLTSYSQIPLL